MVGIFDFRECRLSEGVYLVLSQRSKSRAVDSVGVPMVGALISLHLVPLSLSLKLCAEIVPGERLFLKGDSHVVAELLLGGLWVGGDLF